MLYKANDLSAEGKHDFTMPSDDDLALMERWAQTFSVGIFKWELKGNKRALKKGKAIIRIKAPIDKSKDLILRAQRVCKELDAGTFDLNVKTITIKS